MNNSSVGQQIRMYPHQSARYCDAEGLRSSFAEDHISTDQKPFFSVHSVNRRYTLKGVQGAPHPFTGTLKVLFKSWTHKARIKHTCQSLTLIGTFVIRDCFPLCTESVSTNMNSGILAQSGYYFNSNSAMGQQIRLPFPTHQVPQQCSSSLIVPGWTHQFSPIHQLPGASQHSAFQQGGFRRADDILSLRPPPFFQSIHRLPGASPQPALQGGEFRRPDDIPPQGPALLKHSIDRILGTSQQNALQHFPSNDLANSVASMSHSNPPPQNQSNLEQSESGGTQASSHKKHECNECDQKFSYQSQLKSHIAAKHGDGFPCTRCNVSCMSVSRLNYHIRHEHGDGFPCTRCDFSCMSLSDMNSHNFREHGIGFKCPKCEFAFTTTRGLNYHMVKKHNGKGFRCTICDVSCMSVGGLKNHMFRTHHLW